MGQKSMTTQGRCVTINVNVKCDKCNKKENYIPCSNEPKKDDNNESCVDINVYVECDDQKDKN